MKPYQQALVDIINAGAKKFTTDMTRRAGKSHWHSTFGMWTDEVISEFDQRYNWCLENLGPAADYPPRWEPGELGHPLRFRFRDTRDELWFKLRWGTC